MQDDGDLRGELEKSLRELAQQMDKRNVVERIRPIIFVNLQRGRVRYFLEAHPEQRADAYVRLVEEKYFALSDYLHRLRVEKAAEVWLPLYAQLQQWAFNYLVGKGIRRDRHTFQMAVECAADAAALVTSIHFPYDTDFDPWAYTVVQNVCRQRIHKEVNNPNPPDHKLVNLEEYLLPPAVKHDRPSEASDLRADLLDAIDELSSPERKQVICQYYLEGKSFQDITAILGKSMNAVYRLHFDALRELAKILRRKGYK